MGDFTDMLRNGYGQLSELCGVPNVTEPFIDNTTPDENDDGKTFLDYFIENTKVVGEQTFLTQPMGDGKVLTWTYSEVLEQAKKAAGYISVCVHCIDSVTFVQHRFNLSFFFLLLYFFIWKSLNLPPKSQIAIMSKNCAWWIIADLGVWLSGHVSVPGMFVVT